MNSHELKLYTYAPAQTEALGRVLGRLLGCGALVALRGELATGKTCLVRGMADALEASVPVTSPTFTLVNEYAGRLPLIHADLYRLVHLDEIEGLGYEELFDAPEGITVVEWAERAEPLLPDTRLDVSLFHKGGDTRLIEICDHGVLNPAWSRELRDAPELREGIKFEDE